eukprot:849883-Pleurochrysis_carterae.AAC.1
MFERRFVRTDVTKRCCELLYASTEVLIRVHSYARSPAARLLSSLGAKDCWRLAHCPALHAQAVPRAASQGRWPNVSHFAPASGQEERDVEADGAPNASSYCR